MHKLRPLLYYAVVFDVDLGHVIFVENDPSPSKLTFFYYPNVS